MSRPLLIVVALIFAIVIIAKIYEVTHCLEYRPTGGLVCQFAGNRVDCEPEMACVEWK